MPLSARISKFAVLISAVFLPLASAKAIDFETQIQPILKDKCFKCHSGPKAKAKLRYDDGEKLAEKVGEEEGIIIPGKPEESLLIQLTKRMLADPLDPDGMPPSRRGTPLTGTEIALISKWIAEGAITDKGGTAMTEGTDAGKLIWTSTEGKTITAGFIRLEAGNVVLKLEDGREYPLPLDRLSPDSQAQAKKLGAE